MIEVKQQQPNLSASRSGAAQRFLQTILEQPAIGESGERVVLVAHQVVVLLVRYVLEGLSEQEILEVDKQAEVANCSVTTYRHDAALGVRGGLRLDTYNEVDHLERAHEDVTAEPDVPGAPR